jgi:L-asparaginase
MAKHRRVLIIHTGGTLGMQSPDRTRLDLGDDGHLQRLIERVPELAEIADIDLVAPWNLDSSDIGPDEWVRLAEMMVRQGGVGERSGDGSLKGYDGIVVIHGTDTMAYTASAISYMMDNLDRPIVFTGSQRPLEAWRSDARANLAAAVELATMDVPEVLIAFGDVILRGCRASKIDANSYRAFAAPSSGTIGSIGTELSVRQVQVRQPGGDFELRDNIDTRVLALTLFPGLDSEMVHRAVMGSSPEDRIKAVVLRGFGVGNVPLMGRSDLRPMISAFASHGIPMVITSQCYRGHTDLRLYAAGRALLEAGAIQARDMTFEAAITKAMWASGNPERTVGEWFDTDLAGEVSI